jgi:hypothetical protein
MLLRFFFACAAGCSIPDVQCDGMGHANVQIVRARRSGESASPEMDFANPGVRGRMTIVATEEIWLLNPEFRWSTQGGHVPVLIFEGRTAYPWFDEITKVDCF